MPPSTDARAIVFGTGNFARVLAHYLSHDLSAFVVDEPFRATPTLLGKPVLVWSEIGPADGPLFAAVGYSNRNRNREAVFARARAAGFRQPGLGGVNEGTFVFPGVILEPYVEIGVNVVLWAGAHVAHDTVIGDHVFVSPQATIGGNCRIGERSFIGLNATLRDGITIGAECIIGAGAVVLEDVPAGTVVTR